MPANSKNLIEDGIPAGTWNKYHSRNPIQRFLVNRFLERLRQMAEPYASEKMTAVDVGCGEGTTTKLLRHLGFDQIIGYDFSDSVLGEARSSFPDIPFKQKNIYELNEDDRFAFVSACEVLEHLDDPERGLRQLAKICQDTALFSVPNEPLFRGLNLCAGKYVTALGNSPGHLNHWNSRSFVRFVQREFNVKAVSTPMPWTIVIAQPKS